MQLNLITNLGSNKGSQLKVNNRECKILEGENQLRKKENIFKKEYRINNEFKKNLERKNEVLSQKLVKDESYLFLFRVSVFLMVMLGHLKGLHQGRGPALR